MAREIAAEASRGYERMVPAHVLAEMRRILVFDLVCTDEGRAELGGCLGQTAPCGCRHVPIPG
ncbi:MAG: hypothetical protein U0414_11365 [Polyangiaceae bacterium]